MATASETSVVSRSPEATIALGRRLGSLLTKGDVVALCGPLGSGKTTLTKGLAAGLGFVESAEVKSPTFVLIHEYAGRLPVYHVDLYRLDQLEEAARLGLEQYLDGDGVCIIEWADKFPSLVPRAHLRVTLAHHDVTTRHLQFTAHGPHYAPVLQALQQPLRLPRKH